jgi:hypothetical protein
VVPGRGIAPLQALPLAATESAPRRFKRLKTDFQNGGVNPAHLLTQCAGKKGGNSRFSDGCCATRLHYKKSNHCLFSQHRVLEKRVEAKKLFSVRFVGWSSARTAIGDLKVERQQQFALPPLECFLPSN